MPLSTRHNPSLYTEDLPINVKVAMIRAKHTLKTLLHNVSASKPSLSFCYVEHPVIVWRQLYVWKKLIIIFCSLSYSLPVFLTSELLPTTTKIIQTFWLQVLISAYYRWTWIPSLPFLWRCFLKSFFTIRMLQYLILRMLAYLFFLSWLSFWGSVTSPISDGLNQWLFLFKHC